MRRSWIDLISTQLRRHLASSSIRWLWFRGGSSKNRWQQSNWWLPYLSVSCTGNNAREFLKSDHRTQHRPKPCSLATIQRWWILHNGIIRPYTRHLVFLSPRLQRDDHRTGAVWCGDLFQSEFTRHGSQTHVFAGNHVNLINTLHTQSPSNT